MSGLELVAAVAALAPLIQGAAQLLKEIRKRTKKKERERAFLENELQNSLEKGELEIRHEFVLYADHLGDAFRRGDQIAQERFQYIIFEAKNIQRILQLTRTAANTVYHEYDPRKLRESSDANRHNARQTMQDLSSRILSMRPMLMPPHPADAMPPTPQPQPQPQPQPRRQDSSLSTASTIAYLPPLNLEATQYGSNFERSLNTTLPLQPYYTAPNPPLQPYTASTKLPEVRLKEILPDSPPKRPSLTSSPYSVDYARRSTESLGTTNTKNTNKGSIGKASTSNSTESRSQGTPTSAAAKRRSTLGSIQGTGHLPPLKGRPEKSNNYHGFCKGAWGIQSDPKKHLDLIKYPLGQRSFRTFWQCKECRFRGDPVELSRGEFEIADQVYDADCGIQYKWLFLAKSHQKCKDQAKNNENAHERMAMQHYGCSFCCNEGKYTESFGNVETLMNHIYEKHSSEHSVTTNTLLKTNCILGRKARPTEDFDINIPVSLETQQNVSLIDASIPEFYGAASIPELHGASTVPELHGASTVPELHGASTVRELEGFSLIELNA